MVSPRIVSELQKLTCLTCGVTFAVSKDYLYAQLDASRTILICPNGHTTPFTTRSINSSSTINDLRKRIIQLETELARKKHAPIPMPTRSQNIELGRVANTIVWDHRDGEVVQVRERAEVEKKPPFGHSNLRQEKINTKRPNTTQCPYCFGWFRKSRDHARSAHPDRFKSTDFGTGVR